MADENEDQWLYGSNPPAPDPAPSGDAPMEEAVAPVTADSDKQPDEEGTVPETADEPAANGDAAPPENGENTELLLDDIDDESDDDVNVVIGDIKTTPSGYAPFKIGGKAAQYSTPAASDKSKNQGTFSLGEFEAMGNINGVPAHEFNIDALDDKPWRKPGADITDFFNYGFNETTWRAYCERQQDIRLKESFAGVANIPYRPFQTGVSDKMSHNKPPPVSATPVMASRPSGIEVLGRSAPSRRLEMPDQPPMSGPGGFSMPPPSVLPPPAPAPSGYMAPPPGYPYGQPMSAPPPPVPGYYEPPPYQMEQPYAPPPGTWNNPPPAWPVSGVPPPMTVEPPCMSPVDSLRDRDMDSLRDRDMDSLRDRDMDSLRDRDMESIRDRDMDPYGRPPSRARSPDRWSPGRDRERDRERDDRKERDSRHHRRRSRSRSRERSRRHRSRSRSPSHRHSRKKNKKRDKTEAE